MLSFDQHPGRIIVHWARPISLKPPLLFPQPPPSWEILRAARERVTLVAEQLPIDLDRRSPTFSKEKVQHSEPLIALPGATRL